MTVSRISWFCYGCPERELTAAQRMTLRRALATLERRDLAINLGTLGFRDNRVRWHYGRPTS